MKRKKKKRRPRTPDDEVYYDCTHCGEAIVIEVDLSAGAEQEFIEDCPVCCNPHRLNVTLDADGGASVHAERP